MNQGVQLMVPPVTPMVKKLIIANLGIWILGQLILERVTGFPISGLFALYPMKVISEFFIWQPFTYMFLHSNQWSHIIFNMLMLWFAGGELEQRWGSRFFLAYYLVSGVGAAVIYVIGMAIFALLTGSTHGLIVPVIGASGAVFGVLLAYGIIFGDRIIHFMLLFPMKAKYFVMLLGGVQLVAMLSAGAEGTEVAYLAHLGGLISGYLFLHGWTRYKQAKWKSKMRPKSRKLHLIVDNEKDPKNKDGDDGPKYWH